MAGWTQDATARPPFLTEPRLYVAAVLESVPDERIVEALSECLRLRPMIERQTGSMTAEATGYVEFESLDRAEKAYAIANPAWLPEYNCSLRLHLSPPPSSDPSPSATARVFKALPLNTTPGALFDLCRPFGPVHRAALHYAPAYPLGSGSAEFKGQAYVTFYDEKDAQKATDDLHCTEFGGSTICVEPYIKPKPRQSDSSTSRWADSPSFVPVGLGHPSLNAVAPSFSPTRNFSGTSQTSIYSQPALSPGLPPHIHQAATTGAAIDPCNLFIKSLDPSLTSQDLYAAFAPYGQIVSARVMRNDQTGVSKEFGFVSFTTPAEASAALIGMDGAKLVGVEGRGKHIVVRLHEPKKFREGRLKQRYSGAGDDVESRLSSLSFGESPDRSPHGSVYDMARHQSADTDPSSPENSISPLPAHSPTPLSEQERLLVAVRKVQPDQADAIVELLMGLPKKERAMCLFNPEHLKTKIADALIILTPDSDSEEVTPANSPAASLPTPASTPKAKKVVAVPATFAKLAQLPAADFVQLVTSTSLSSLGVERVDATLEEDTDAFMDRLEGKPVAEVKQKLGDRVFKVVKSLGVKGAPKITIQLLDAEDLRALAHLADYPAVMKERISLPSIK